ncbi:hypothetical protein ACJ41O_010991 [Fusarium nematophilum]
MAVVVIVPGSFAPAKHYSVLTNSLAENGVESVVIDTPSVGRREGLPPQTMSDDVNEIVRAASKLLDEGKDVILMTHSYGGIPGTQSLEKLSRKARSAAGQSGGVDKIIYLTSEDYMRLDPEGQTPFTFSDLPAEEGLKLAKGMPEHSTASFKEKLTYPGYNDVDVTYIVCEEDKTIPPEYQYAMIELLKSSTGKDIDVQKLKSGHAPNVSQPDNVSRIVKGVVS